MAAFRTIHFVKKHQHIVHGLGHHLEHLIDLMHHAVVEFHVVLVLALHSLGHVEASVGDGFDLADYAEHAGDAHLTLWAEASLGGIVQIGANLNLHTVGDLFVFLDAVVKILIFLSLGVEVYQLAAHVQHTVHTLAVKLYFLLSLKNVELGCRHQAAADIFEGEFLLFLLVTRRNHPADDFDVQFCEPYHHKQVECVEHRREHRQAECHATLSLGGVSTLFVQQGGAAHPGFLCRADVHRVGACAPICDVGHKMHKGIEYAEHNDGTEHVEQQMSHGGAFCVDISAQ